MGDTLQPIPASETKPSYALIGISILVLLAAWYLFRRKTPAERIVDEKILTWNEVAYIDEQGNARLKPARIQEVQRKLKEFDEAEQYVLLARKDGWYLCQHCGQGTCYLRALEVAKYGVTRKGERMRYDRDYLARMNLDYQVQFRGNYAECLKAELAQIAKYPLLPENLRREAHLRLARPPMNQVDF